MENKDEKRSYLKLSEVSITDKIKIKIPTVGEMLDNEQDNYGMISSLTAVPFQYMFQLDNMNIDFTTISDYQLFLMLFPVYAKQDMSLIFGDMNTSDYIVGINKENGNNVLFSQTNGLDYIIDESIYMKLVSTLRKIYGIERVNTKPGNDKAKEYLLEKERRKQKRHRNDKYKPYLENIVIALVNNSGFKYNYEQVMDMTIYNFNQSFDQIKRSIEFDKTMIGVYTGNVDTTKLDKSSLTWLNL